MTNDRPRSSARSRTGARSGAARSAQARGPSAQLTRRRRRPTQNRPSRPPPPRPKLRNPKPPAPTRPARASLLPPRGRPPPQLRLAPQRLRARLLPPRTGRRAAVPPPRAVAPQAPLGPRPPPPAPPALVPLGAISSPMPTIWTPRQNASAWPSRRNRKGLPTFPAAAGRRQRPAWRSSAPRSRPSPNWPRSASQSARGRSVRLCRACRDRRRIRKRFFLCREFCGSR